MWAPLVGSSSSSSVRLVKDKVNTTRGSQLNIHLKDSGPHGNKTG